MQSIADAAGLKGFPVLMPRLRGIDLFP